MSRSYRRRPFHGVCGGSDKRDKVESHRRLRVAQRSAPEDGPAPVLRDVSDPWDMNKDGKLRFDPVRWPAGMRK